MPRLISVERDYPATAAKMAALGPLTDTLGNSVKGVTWIPAGAVDYLRRANGTVRGGVTDGRPALTRDVHMAEAILALAGVVILAGRRLLVPRVRATSPVDYVALILLLVIIVTGVVPTLFVNLFGHGYDYRTTVAPWFRGLFSGSPDVTAIAHAPIVYQVHAASAWLIWAVWPFSRLVPAWSVPAWYLRRPYIVYRSRVASPPPEPGTSGRRWRKIGVPY
jgi:hypothetical protein